MDDKKIVDPNLYSKDYFLSDNEGWREYLEGLDTNIHPKFKKALRLANAKAGDNILDIGCGRGELIYYFAKLGASVLGIDYSKAAIDVANETIKRLPKDLQCLARAEVADVTAYDFMDKYDIVLMLEVFEHMHDWQLVAAFKKISKILNKGGRLIILTPNYYYEKYLSPIKRALNIPLNLFKWPLGVIRGRYKPKDLRELLKKIFRVRVGRGELNRMMHVNVSTPGKIRALLSDYEVSLGCEDDSKNIASLLTRRWWGREIVAVAKKNKF